MVLDVKKITTAYRCKSCGSTVFGISGAVALSGDLIKLKCKCGESELSLKSTNDGKFRVTIPCVFCQKDHQFLISKKLLLTKDLFTYPCPYSGLDIVFFGEEDKVKKAEEASTKEIYDSLSSDELNQLHEMESNEDDVGDDMIRSNIIFVLEDMIDNDDVRCNCEKGDYILHETSRDVTIECKKCGAKKIYYCDNSPQTRELLEAATIKLD